MLDQQELNQFRGVVHEVVTKIVNDAIDTRVPPMVHRIVNDAIDTRVPPIVRKIVVEVVHEELLSFYEHQLLPQFDETNREFARMRNVNVTKDYQEERLDKFRIDLGLKYRPV